MLTTIPGGNTTITAHKTVFTFDVIRSWAFSAVVRSNAENDNFDPHAADAA
jgi:hypothetical protein